MNLVQYKILLMAIFGITPSRTETIHNQKNHAILNMNDFDLRLSIQRNNGTLQYQLEQPAIVCLMQSVTLIDSYTHFYRIHLLCIYYSLLC